MHYLADKHLCVIINVLGDATIAYDRLRCISGISKDEQSKVSLQRSRILDLPSLAGDEAFNNRCFHFMAICYFRPPPGHLQKRNVPCPCKIIPTQFRAMIRLSPVIPSLLAWLCAAVSVHTSLTNTAVKA